MSKVDRIRTILVDYGSLLLPINYDGALLGIRHTEDKMQPVYSYLKLVEVHMSGLNISEEESVNYVENQFVPNEDLIVVDDTGV